MTAMDNHPRALAHRAEVARLRGEYDEAKSLFRRSVSLLQEQEDAEGEAEALHSLAAIARSQRDFPLAFTYLDRRSTYTSIRASEGRWQHARVVLVAMARIRPSEVSQALQRAENGDDAYRQADCHTRHTCRIRGDLARLCGG